MGRSGSGSYIFCLLRADPAVWGLNGVSASTLVRTVISVEGMVQGAIEGVGPGLLRGVWSPDEGDRCECWREVSMNLPVDQRGKRDPAETRSTP